MWEKKTGTWLLVIHPEMQSIASAKTLQMTHALWLSFRAWLCAAAMKKILFPS